MAQFGRALRSGRRGRGFESRRFDELGAVAQEIVQWLLFFLDKLAKTNYNQYGKQRLTRRAEYMIRGSKAELAAEVQKMIEKNYKEKFSLQKIADELYVNRSYISRVFAQVYGMTMVKYHNYMRCLHSLDLLDQRGIKIEYIGEAVGYVSLSHYIKEFKRFFKMTPSRYRKLGEIPKECFVDLGAVLIAS